MNAQLAPRAFALDPRDSRAILARNHVGRLAFAWGGEIDLRPLHYVYRQGMLYGRTSHGAKFERLDSLPVPVAFLVDEVEAMFQWRSVLVRGSLHLLSPETSQREEWQRAVEQLRRLVPDSFTPEDPLPLRSLVFRIDVEEITGRGMEDPRRTI